MPKFSIITVNYNNAEGLKQTIDSVLNQSLTEFEFIVVDGNSTDGSLDVIEKHSERITQWISKTDTGVYQAMNRGIGLAKGDYLLFLNSGDTFRNTNILEEANEKINSECDIYYGNLMFTHSGKEMLQEYPDELYFDYFLERSLPHPGSFIKRALFDRYFYYSEEYRIVSDWEFFIYVICKAKVSYKHLGIVMSNFDLQGMSNNPKNKAKINEERELILEKHFPEEFQKFKDEQFKIARKNKKFSAKLIRTLGKFFKTKTVN
jgi:glycosyltransferase involved in cell wall biosynthesis